MQLHIWGEMKAGGMHSRLTDPPTTTMFGRAGGGDAGTKRKSAVVLALTEAATAITSAVFAKPQDARGCQKPPSGNGSPAKLIENRSKLYRQLSD